MNDKELLEMAAKAAGIAYQLDDDGIAIEYFGGGLQLPFADGKWNPLTDDGDALRLVMKLDMSVDIDRSEESTYTYAGKVPKVCAMENWCGDKDAATRRAIVRAAAKLNKGTK